MQTHLKAIGIKAIFTMTILFSLLPVFESISIWQMVFMALLLTISAYIIVDLVLLPMFGNIAASIIDFGLAFLFIWTMSAFLIGQTASVVMMSAAGAYFFAFCEALFHIYMKDKVLPKKKAAIIPFPKTRLQTEFSEELDGNTNEENEDK